MMKFWLGFFLILIAACSQKPASIVYKGHLYFTENSLDLEDRKVAKKIEVKDIEIDLKETKNVVTVVKGDSLYSIAKAHKVSIRSLIEYNGYKPPYTLYPGNIVKIPSKRKTYVVKKGDNMTFIARNHDVSLRELAGVNDLPMNYKVRIGEILALPFGADAGSQEIKPKAPLKTRLAKAKKPSYKAPVVSSKKLSFIWPVDGEVVQKFGPKANGTHNDGINIKASADTPVKAVAPGKVVYVGNELRGYGNLIIIKHPDNWLTAYAHNNQIFVAKNQEVEQGESIATVGATGNVKSSQLHFGLRKGRKAVDPIKYLKKQHSKVSAL